MAPRKPVTRPPGYQGGGGRDDPRYPRGPAVLDKGPPPPIGPPPDPPYQPTPGQFATLRMLLQRYGLESLYDTAVGWLIDGTADDENRLQIALRETPEFQQRFRGIFDREQNGLPPISVNEYLAYEDFAFQTMRELGFPPGFYDDTDDFADLIGRNVSMNEFRQRAELYVDAATAGRDQIRTQLALHLGPEVAEASDGLTDSELAAWTIDPARALPALRQRMEAAKVSAAGVGSGFGALSYEQATRLTGAGVTEDQARQTLGALSQQGDVAGALAGEDASSGLDRDTLVGVAAGDAAAAEELERRRRRRLGGFQGGGGFATGREGIGGVGSA